MPQLSIITPFRNAAPWLVDCLNSGISQNFTGWEWVLVDDHSGDDSAQIIADFAETDHRLKLLSNPGNGIIPALQHAFENCTGTFITRMDADDVMPEGRLEKMVKALQNSPSKTLITGKVRYFGEEVISRGYSQYEEWLNSLETSEQRFQNIYRECVIASPNWMVRRSELQNIKGFQNLTYPEDYDLVFRWYQNDFQLKILPDITLLWREHPYRTSRISQNYTQEAFFNLKVRKFVELDYQGRNLCLWGTGTKGRLTARVLDALGVPFHWMDLEAKGLPISGHPVMSFGEIEKFLYPQILLAVYPPPTEREDLLNYLQTHYLYEGRDFWVL